MGATDSTQGRVPASGSINQLEALYHVATNPDPESEVPQKKITRTKSVDSANALEQRDNYTVTLKYLIQLPVR